MGNKSSKKRKKAKAEAEAMAKAEAKAGADANAQAKAQTQAKEAEVQAANDNTAAGASQGEPASDTAPALAQDSKKSRRQSKEASLRAVSTIDDPSAWQPGAYEHTHKDIVTQEDVRASLVGDNSDSSSSSEEELIDDWLDEEDPVADHPEVKEVEKKNCIPETEFCEFFWQFTLEHQRLLLDIMETKNYTDGQDIVTQGDQGDSFYVIQDGEAVVVKREDGEEREVTHLYPGQNFGEIAMIYGGERVASVRAVGRCKCLTLSKAVFEQQHDVRMFLITKKVPLLADLTQEDRIAIVSKLQPRAFEKGDYVIRQGEKVADDAFFMITKGQAAVVDVRKDGTEKQLTRLFEGHCFGEMALVTDEPRTASIVARSTLKCMCLTKQDFNGALSGSDIQGLVRKFAKDRSQLRMKRKQSYGTVNLDREQMRQKSLVNMREFVKKTKVEISGSQKKGNLKINYYEIGRKLGTGSYSTVYLSTDTRTREEVAIKVMDKHKLGKKTVGSKTSLLDDVYREVKAQCMLRHEGIVQLIEIIDDPEHKDIYLVQELVRGGEIQTGGKPLPPETTRAYFRDLLRGVEYMHSLKVVHRDIKPENILITDDDPERVKIADFGTAVIVKAGEQLTVPKGTPAFMAPELLSYDTCQYSGPPADIWSLGATLFMLVVGTPPWNAMNEIELARKVKNDELIFPESAHRGPDKLNPHLMHLIKNMLSKDPALRPRLESIMEHEWVTKEGSEPMPPLYGSINLGSDLDVQDVAVEVKSDECDSSDDDDGDDFDLIGSDSLGLDQESKNSKENDPSLQPLEADAKLPDCVVESASKFSKSLRIKCAVADDIGPRGNMEDKPCVHPNLKCGEDSSMGFFATFDGHGGDGASTLLQLNLHNIFAQESGILSDTHNSIIKACHKMDWRILRSAAEKMAKKASAGKSLMRTSRKSPNEDNHLSGATAAMVLALDSSKIWVAWAGDSRIVLSRSGTAVGLSEDHKATREDEKKRVQQAGGSVDHKGRVGGDLAVSRAFGDIMHKGAGQSDFLASVASTEVSDASELQKGPLICTPDVKDVEIDENCEFLIIASDGVWDVLENQEAVNFVRRHLFENGGNLSAAAQALVQKALKERSVDNVSAVLVVFNQD